MRAESLGEEHEPQTYHAIQFYWVMSICFGWVEAPCEHSNPLTILRY